MLIFRDARELLLYLETQAAKARLSLEDLQKRLPTKHLADKRYLQGQWNAFHNAAQAYRDFLAVHDPTLYATVTIAEREQAPLVRRDGEGEKTDNGMDV